MNPSPENEHLHKTINVVPCILDNLTLAEYVPKERIYALLKSNHLGLTWDETNNSHKYSSLYHKNQIEQLTAYLSTNNNSKDQCFRVRYFKCKDKFGRAYIYKALGLTAFSRKVRNTLIKDLYYDFDIKNCQPEIIYNLCKEHNIQCPFILKYIQNRDDVLSTVMNHYNIDRDKAKKLILRLCFFGTVEGFFIENNMIGMKNDCSFLINFKGELERVANQFKRWNPTLYEITRHKSEAKLTKNYLGSFFSIFLQEYECRIVSKVLEWLFNETDVCYKKGISDKIAIYEYDGIKLLQETVDLYGKEKLLSDIISKTEELTGFKLIWELKPIDKYFDISNELLQLEAEAKNSVYPVDELHPMLSQVLRNQSDNTLAEAIKLFFCENFVCSSIKHKIWYQFSNHKWSEIDGGYSLRNAISKDFPELFSVCKNKLNDLSNNLTPHVDKATLHKDIVSLERLISKCGDNKSKNEIMNELCNICYVEKFLDKLDTNPYLLCCSNGVIDLQNKIFRDGKPSDYCSLSTNIPYQKVDTIDSSSYKGLCEFIEQLFPYQAQRKYMIQHLSSVLFGTGQNQAFNYYLGKGSNGKSKLISLMSATLGDYKAVVPSTLITSKKPSIGGTSSEVVLLRGRRFAVMQEPTKGETINEGIFKELTGGDCLQGRALFKDCITFKPMFNLAICANVLMNVKSNDDGTWRRIKVVEFMSKFCDKPDPDNELEFRIDYTIDDKINSWSIPFLSFLVENAFELQGRVDDCAFICEASNKYRKDQNKVLQFIESKLIKGSPDDVVSKSSVAYECNNWFELNYKYKINNKELFSVLDETYDSNSKDYFGLRFIDDCDVTMTRPQSKEELFLEEFNKDFEVTRNKEDFIRSISINEWAKLKGLKVNTSKSINLILLESFGLDSKNKEHFKYKKLDGEAVSCWIGVKLK